MYTEPSITQSFLLSFVRRELLRLARPEIARGSWAIVYVYEYQIRFSAPIGLSRWSERARRSWRIAAGGGAMAKRRAIHRPPDGTGG